jgi:hypothetical protein
MTRIGFSAGEIAECAGVHDIAGQLPDHLIGNAAIHDEAVENYESLVGRRSGAQV